MRIGEVSKRSGLAAHTIRYYESEGLLPRPSRSGNGYREYNEESLKRLAGIQCAKHLGFSLEDIRMVFGERENPETINHERILAQLDQRLREVEDLVKRLMQQKKDILHLKSELSDTWLKGQCMDADKLKLLTTPTLPDSEGH